METSEKKRLKRLKPGLLIEMVDYISGDGNVESEPKTFVHTRKKRHY